MPYDETINSSDVEMSPQRASRFGNTGQISIEHMIEHAMSDRLSSKKVIRQLEFTKGRPQLQYQNLLWMRRLQSFRFRNVLLIYYECMEILMVRGPRTWVRINRAHDLAGSLRSLVVTRLRIKNL